jgi:hypothetical protein
VSAVTRFSERRRLLARRELWVCDESAVRVSTTIDVGSTRYHKLCARKRKSPKSANQLVLTINRVLLMGDAGCGKVRTYR